MDKELNTAPWQEHNSSRSSDGAISPNREETTEYVPADDYPGYHESEDGSESARVKTTRKKRKKRKKNKNYLLRIFIVLCALVAIFCVLHVDYFTVDKVSVEGTDYLSASQVLENTNIKTGTNIWDVHGIIEKHKIKENEYVDTVKIKRKLPNEIVVTITEKTGLAQFQKGKKYIITDNDGKVIEIAKEQRRVTLVEGFDVKKAKLHDKITFESDKSYDKVMNLLAKTSDGDLFFKKVNVSDGRVTAYIYDDLKVKGSYSNVIDSLKSGILKTVVYNLYQKGKKKGTINVSGDNYCSFTQ